MKKVLLSMALVIIFVAYALRQNSQNNSGQIQTTTAATTGQTQNLPGLRILTPTTTGHTATQTVVASSGSNPAQTTAPNQTASVSSRTPSVPVATTPAPAPAPAQTGQYTNGTYTGQAADAVYGSVQVAAVISGGKLTDVQILQAPNDRSTSRDIASQAMPQLVSEAIAAQSAQVDVISGATQDSQAFQQSLQSALSQAKS